MTVQKEPRWVLIPGTLCSSEVFDPVLACLGVARERRHVLMVDAPFAGDYAARLENLIEEGDIVCGFSLGSLVLAHNLGSLGRARAVVLLSLNPLADAWSNARNRRNARDRIASGDPRGWVRDNWAGMSVGDDPEIMNFVADMAEETVALIGAQTELALTRTDATQNLRDSDVPMIFVTGSEDQMTPPGPIMEIGSVARNAYVEVLDGRGHFALLEAPDRVAAAIRTGLTAILTDDENVV